MTLNLYQIDAFTDTVFGGNPACVVPLESWLADELLFKVTRENAVPETAFFVRTGDKFHLRWFTPEIEMDLCGHATLATAHCLREILGDKREAFVFETMSGELRVTWQGNMFHMDFPSRMPLAARLPTFILEALSIEPLEVLKARDYVLVYGSEADIRNLVVNRSLLDRINTDPGGVIVTAKGDQVDFVSRFFTPQASITEDPATGSAHCSLIPFWAARLGKKDMAALQVSERVGKFFCQDKGDRVIIGGQATTYSTGTIRIG